MLVFLRNVFGNPKEAYTQTLFDPMQPGEQAYLWYYFRMVKRCWKEDRLERLGRGLLAFVGDTATFGKDQQMYFNVYLRNGSNGSRGVFSEK